MAQALKVHDDPLLAELQGEPIKIEDVDSPKQETSDPLEVKAKAQLSPKKKMDAIHSTAAGGKGYRVTVKGEYFAQSRESNAKLRKPYQLDFNLPNLEAALSTIVGKLLEPALRKTNPDFFSYRTHEIVDVQPLSPSTPESGNIQYMARPRLERHILDNRIPINSEDYADVVHLREAVIDFTLNRNGFEEREAAKQAERKELAELAELNPGLDVGANSNG